MTLPKHPSRFLLGAWTTWFWISIIYAVLPLLLFLGMLFMSETHMYLLITGRVDEAKKNLAWFRGAETLDQIEPEIKIVAKGFLKMIYKIMSWHFLGY